MSDEAPSRNPPQQAGGGQLPPTITLPGNRADDTQNPDSRSTATFDREEAPNSGEHLDPKVPQLTVPGFKVQGFLGRGGMGIVLRARDLELDRDVAVKVLRNADDGSSSAAQRFVEEAHITGQLQHPGIAPVYRFGTLPDGNPFFAMKLIQGRTLAELLAERQDSSQDRSKFLKIFEQICQTLAYAHSRRVIHRDLKPSNIMVGAFGEVQVMDWGLAKVMAGRITKPSQRHTTAAAKQLMERTSHVPLKEPAETSAGSILGTPAYMPQEQALGEIERLDERCDVFSLGASLCQILTGIPPYLAENSQALLQMAATADLTGAISRLESCGADGELISLAKRCLDPDPGQRPQDAAVLAASLTAYLESVDARLRRAELDRAKAEVRAKEERRRRRLAIALAAALLLLVVAGSGGLFWYRGQQLETERIANVAIGKAEQFRDQAAKMTVAGEIVAKPGVDILDQADSAVREAEGAATAWKQAEAAAQEAEAALAAGIANERLRKSCAALGEQIGQQRMRINARLKTIKREQQLLQDLDAAHMAKGVWLDGRFDYAGSARQYAEAFAKFGLDIRPGITKELAKRIDAERGTIREAMIVALDDWSASAWASHATPSGDDLRELVSAIDKDPWRKRLRHSDDPADFLTMSAEARRRPPAVSSIIFLAGLLESTHQPDAAVSLLRWARQRYPGNFSIPLVLGYSLRNGIVSSAAQSEEMLGCFRTALALRPRSAIVRFNLGQILADRNQWDEAIAEYRNAIEIDPTFSFPHNGLGNVFAMQNQFSDATTEYQAAIRIDPTNAIAHNNFGNLLATQGEFDLAIAQFRLAIKFDPHNATFHNHLGNVLAQKQLIDEAMVEHREATRIDPMLAVAHYGLGKSLAHRNDLKEAIKEFRLAIKLDPKYASAHNELGIALLDQSQIDEAIAEFGQAIRLDPKSANAHANLGNIYRDRGEFEPAKESLLRAFDLFSPNSAARNSCAESLRDIDRLIALATRLDGVLTGYDQLENASERMGLIEVCRLKRLFAGAVKLYLQAVSADPNLFAGRRASQRYNAACVAALAGSGQGEDAGTLDEAEMSKFRSQSIDWLRNDLDVWSKFVETGKADARLAAVKTLRHWQKDADLAGIREPQELEKLPAEERESCQKLWADVASLLEKASAKP